MTWLRSNLHKYQTGWVTWLGGMSLFAALLGCSGSVETVAPTVDASGGYVFVTSGGAPIGAGGDVLSSGGSTASGGATGTGGRVYVEPECPDVAPPPPEEECDPLVENDCGEGFACRPYLIYPNGERCGDPQYGSLCQFAGQSEQGDPCADGINSCAAGYMCILGAAGGKRCARICKPTIDHMCPGGLICGLTDVQGYGVCY